KRASLKSFFVIEADFLLAILRIARVVRIQQTDLHRDFVQQQQFDVGAETPFKNSRRIKILTVIVQKDSLSHHHGRDSVYPNRYASRVGGQSEDFVDLKA